MATTVEIFRHRRNINPVLERAPRDLYMIVALFDENHTYLVSVDGRNHVNQVGIIVATITRTLAIFQREGAPDNAIFLFHARKDFLTRERMYSSDMSTPVSISCAHKRNADGLVLAVRKPSVSVMMPVNN